MSGSAKRVLRRFAATFMSAFVAQVLARLPELGTVAAYDALVNIMVVSAVAAFFMAADKASREYSKEGR